MAQGQVPVRGCKDDKGEKESEKNGDKDDISSQGADEIDEAEEPHEEEKEAYIGFGISEKQNRMFQKSYQNSREIQRSSTPALADLDLQRKHHMH